MTEEDKKIKKYLKNLFDDFDMALFASALRHIADIMGGVTELSKKTGLTRAGLYKIMNGEREATIASVQKILKAFDLKLTVS